MDELEDERPTGDNALTTGEEVVTYDPTIQRPEVSGENPGTAD